MNSVRLPIYLIASGLIMYVLLIAPFAVYMRNKPIVEKLGYVPSVKLLKPLSVDQKELTAASLVFKVMMYFGGLMNQEEQSAILQQQPDFAGMSRLLHNAVHLDPYNKDAYYFAQGFLTWDAHQFKVANNLLDYGMKYRTWDWQLPYFAGFNYAFFLKDYATAAGYYRRAGDLSGIDLHKSLAGRYLQQSGHTDLAIVYLKDMLKTSKESSITRLYQVRLQAFQEVRKIEQARDHYQHKLGRLPTSIEQLQQLGYLQTKPIDPYGGHFYFEPTGAVATTSKFAFATKNK